MLKAHIIQREKIADILHNYIPYHGAICTISYEVNECMKHMLLNDILQLVV